MSRNRNKHKQPMANFNPDNSSIVDFFSDQSSCMPEPPSEYESQLQKFEADIRNHIRVESIICEC